MNLLLLNENYSLKRKVGLDRAGLVAIWIMLLSISLCSAIVPYTLDPEFYGGVFISDTKVEQTGLPEKLKSLHGVPIGASIMLMLGVSISRWGLWGFDLPVNQLLQVAVPKEKRGTINGVQSSLNMLFGLLEPLMGVVVSNPASFGYITILSLFLVLVAVFIHGRYTDKGGYDAFGVKTDTSESSSKAAGDDIQEVSQLPPSCAGFGFVRMLQTLVELCR